MIKKILLISLFFASSLPAQSKFSFILSAVSSAARAVFPIDETIDAMRYIRGDERNRLKAEKKWLQQADCISIINQTKKVYQEIEKKYDTPIEIYYKSKFAQSEEDLIAQSKILIDHLNQESINANARIDFLGTTEKHRETLARYSAHLDHAEKILKEKLKNKAYEIEAQEKGMEPDELRKQYKKQLNEIPELSQSIKDTEKILGKLPNKKLVIVKSKDGLAGLSLKEVEEQFAQPSAYPKELQAVRALKVNALTPSGSRLLKLIDEYKTNAISSIFKNFILTRPPAKPTKEFAPKNLPFADLSADYEKWFDVYQTATTEYEKSLSKANHGIAEEVKKINLVALGAQEDYQKALETYNRLNAGDDGLPSEEINQARELFQNRIENIQQTGEANDASELITRDELKNLHRIIGLTVQEITELDNSKIDSIKSENKKLYLKSALQLHPDKNKMENAQEEFNELSEKHKQKIKLLDALLIKPVREEYVNWATCENDTYAFTRLGVLSMRYTRRSIPSRVGIEKIKTEYVNTLQNVASSIFEQNRSFGTFVRNSQRRNLFTERRYPNINLEVKPPSSPDMKQFVS